jgi:CxxC motif-containing protein
VFSPFSFKQYLNGESTQLGLSVIALAYLRWVYKIKSLVADTKESADDKGLEAFWLYGTTKTAREYPLGQIKIKGGELSPRIKIHISPTSTQLFYYVKGEINMSDLENILSEKEAAERILNDAVIFAPDETKHFSVKTAKPVESLAMLKMDKRLHELFDQALNAYGDAVIEQGMKALETGVKGNLPLASAQLRYLIDELALSGRKLIEDAKKSGNGNALQLERDFNEALTAPMGELLRKQKKMDLNPKLGDFKE